jgi:hypothetical protein
MSSPLMDWGQKLSNWYKNADTHKQEADPDLVRKANQSFVDAQNRKKLTVDGPTLGAKKTAKKKSTKKPAARKR